MSIIPSSSPEMFCSEPAGVPSIKSRMMQPKLFILYQERVVSGRKLILERVLSDNPSQVPNKEDILIGGNF